MATDFSMYAGDDKTLTISITDADGAPVNVSTATSIRYGVFRGGTLVFVKDLDDGVTVASSTVTVVLDAADTVDLDGLYAHELEIIMDGNTTTALQGHVTIQHSFLTPLP